MHRDPEVGTVEKIEKLSPELEVVTIREPERLVHRQIDSRHSGRST